MEFSKKGFGKNAKDFFWCVCMQNKEREFLLQP